MEPEVAGLIDFSSLDLGGIEPVDLDIQNAYSSWLSEGNTGSLSDFTAATTPTDLTGTGGADQTDTGTIAQPGLLASVLDPKPMIGLSMPKAPESSPPAERPYQISDISDRGNFNFGAMEKPQGLIIHHTGGQGTPDGVMNTFAQRGLATQYIMDREGNIHQALPAGMRGQHIRPSQINGLTNANTLGIEIIAKDDSDLTPAQRDASYRFITEETARYGIPAANVFGHGEINSHKQATEGSSVVNAWREANRIGRPDLGPPAAGGDLPMSQRTLMAYAGRDAPRPPRDVPNAEAGSSPFAPLFEQKAKEYGISARFLDRTANIETGGRYDPGARNRASGASGLFQFMGPTAEQYGLADPFNPEKATDAAARLARDNAEVLKAGLGRAPTNEELYLAHQQGATGALKILQNPDAPVAPLVGETAANRNGGAGLTAGQFAAKYAERFNEGGGPRVQAAAFAPEERARPTSPSYSDRMASIGAQRLPSDGFDGSRLPNVQNVDTTQAERPGLLGELLSPERAIPGGKAPLSNFKTIPGAIDPDYIYQDGPRGLPRAPEPTARDMVASARTGGARPASIARDSRADSPAVRSATVSTTGARPVNPVMQEDLSNSPDGGARQFAAMEAARGGPFSMFVGGQEAPQAATGGAVPAAAGDVPAAGSAPVQSASGGVVVDPAGGGGWKMSDGLSNFFLALGSSLMSSPKGQPLKGFGESFAALQIASQGSAKTAQQQFALASALSKTMNIPMQEAVLYAGNPEAARLVYDNAKTVALNAERQKFAASIPSVSGTDALPPAAPPVPAAPSGQSTPTSPPAGTAPAPAPSPQSQPPTQVPAPATASTTSPQRANLVKLRDQLSDAYGRAPDEQSKAIVKARIDQVDFKLKELGDPVEREKQGYELARLRREAGGKTSADMAERESIANQRGYTGDMREQFIANGRVPSQSEKSLTGEQSNARGFAARMAASNQVLEDPEILSTLQSGFNRRVTDYLPAELGNKLAGEKFQQANQAKLNFITAQLRKESGAVIGKDEYTAADRTYFPQPGEGPDVIRQKAEARRIAIKAMEGSGGAGFKLEGEGAPEKAKAPPVKPSAALDEARSAIARGAPKDAVVKRLQEAGIDPSGL